MWNLFKAELLRFRAWAIAYFLLHLAVLGFLTRVVDLAQQPKFVYQVFAAAYALSGLLLGAYQMGSYRKPNAWLNLLHRPVPPHRPVADVPWHAVELLVRAAHAGHAGARNELNNLCRDNPRGQAAAACATLRST